MGLQRGEGKLIMGENEGTPPEKVTDYRLPRLLGKKDKNTGAQSKVFRVLA